MVGNYLRGFFRELGFEKGKCVRITLDQQGRKIRTKGLDSMIKFLGVRVKKRLGSDQVFREKWRQYLTKGVVRNA